MRVAYKTDNDVEMHRVTSGDRARVSGPALRTFAEIADRWRLSEKERIAILGDPARSTYHQWMKKARDGEALTLPLDTLLRLSGVLGIWKALEVLFPDLEQSLTWLKGVHSGTLFRGAAPITFVTDGATDGILAVRRYLDAWCEDGAGQVDFAPVTEADLVFV